MFEVVVWRAAAAAAAAVVTAALRPMHDVDDGQGEGKHEQQDAQQVYLREQQTTQVERVVVRGDADELDARPDPHAAAAAAAAAGVALRCVWVGGYVGTSRGWELGAVKRPENGSRCWGVNWWGMKGFIDPLVGRSCREAGSGVDARAPAVGTVYMVAEADRGGGRRTGSTTGGGGN